MRASDDIDELAAALAAAQGEFAPVTKTAENPFFHSKYADLPAVVLAASPILSKHGLAVTQLPDFDGENDLLTTRLMHSSGQWLEASMRLHTPKADPQGQGSALTYGRRYAYSGGVGIVTEEDDDGNSATREAGHQSRSSASNGQRSGGTTNAASDKQVGMIRKMAKEATLTADELKAVATAVIKRDVAHLAELTSAEASSVIKHFLTLKSTGVPATTGGGRYDPPDEETPF